MRFLLIDISKTPLAKELVGTMSQETIDYLRNGLPLVSPANKLVFAAVVIIFNHVKMGKWYTPGVDSQRFGFLDHHVSFASK
jgi:hypothetical protein